MSLAFIRLGDTHSHGGAVTSAASGASDGGRGIVTKGCTAICDIHGPTTVAEGDPRFLINGQPATRAFMKLACGAVLMPSGAHISIK